mmetsp:Transcript_23103/g.52942  ORF Transcript_23103/g.52942 Transcript_23103/m.52942 type:complete len:207 (+) Transcript_23103:112-732(+)
MAWRMINNADVWACMRWESALKAGPDQIQRSSSGLSRLLPITPNRAKYSSLSIFSVMELIISRVATVSSLRASSHIMTMPSTSSRTSTMPLRSASRASKKSAGSSPSMLRSRRMAMTSGRSQSRWNCSRLRCTAELSDLSAVSGVGLGRVSRSINRCSWLKRITSLLMVLAVFSFTSSRCISLYSAFLASLRVLSTTIAVMMLLMP